MKRLLTILFVATAFLSFGQVPSYVPTNGLVGWWGFNGNADDESGNGNNGTVSGPTLTDDRFGNSNSSYYFVVNDIIDFGLSNDFAITSSDTKSISLWFNSATGQYPFLNKYQNSVPSNSNFFIGSDPPVFSPSDGIIVTGNGTMSLFWAVIPGDWFHVVAIFNGPNGLVDLYIDSQHVVTVPINYNNSESTNPLTIQGTRMDNDYEDADGKIDDIGMWNRALTQCEISQLYHAQVLDPPGSETVTECDSYTWSTNGQTYTQSGQYTEVLPNQDGCDSTVTLNLTINSSSSSSQTDTGLDSYTWSVNNETYTESGTYTAVIPNAAGCDSTITLDLTLQFTGLHENESSYVAVYPNPTFNSFILSTKDLTIMNYTLVDLQGKVVLTGKMESTEEMVDISKLSKGQYNLVFEDESISPISIIKN